MNKIIKSLILYFTFIVICTGSGYKGSLPNIDAEFEHLRKTNQTTKPVFNTKGNLSGNTKFKRIPRENKTYIDIILKKDKSSPYINDLNDMLPILEKMVKCIDSNGSIQKFNAIASSIIDHADYMSKKYAEKPEHYYISFSKIQSLASQARSVATLRCESLVYIKYLTYQGDGQVYSKDSINEQLQLFKEEIESTIKIIKEST